MVGPQQTDADLRRRRFDRILIIKPSSLGDVVHALPVLHGLRARFPKAKIDWLIASPLAPLLESNREVDDLLLFDRRRFARVGRSLTQTHAFLRFVQDLRRRRYELAIDLQGLFRTGFFAWASGAPVRMGLRNAREGAWIFYTHRLPGADRDTHAVDVNYRVSKPLGFDDVAVEFNLTPTNAERREAGALIRRNLPDGGHRLILVAPGARWATKRWPPERFAAMIDRLQERGLGRCVLIGSRDEVGLCGHIARACRSGPVNLAGTTGVRLLPAVLEGADLVVGHDSAVLHVAAALERPLVCLSGPTNPLRTGPYRRGGDVVRVRLDCAPCYLRKLSQCRHDHRCMQELPVDRVVTAAAARLRAGAPLTRRPAAPLEGAATSRALT